jgi:hypothetical protein
MKRTAWVTLQTLSEVPCPYVACHAGYRLK